MLLRVVRSAVRRHYGVRQLCSFDPKGWDRASHPPSTLSDDNLVSLVSARKIASHRLEDELGDAARAVNVRRKHLSAELQRVNGDASPLSSLPHESYDYDEFYNSILGKNCESVIGYVPIPVGVVGPLNIDGNHVYVPMATTEGALVASTNRGCRAIDKSGGASCEIMLNGMTRAPLCRAKSVKEVSNIRRWLSEPENHAVLAEAFNGTTNFGRLRDIKALSAGRNLYIRFSCFTGDAMGMNMVTKGTVAALNKLVEAFPDLEVVSLSGNVCSDKKPAAINWVEGRGRSLACEVILTKEVVREVLKTTPEDMIAININKNLVGSAVAGSVGGFNAHAANIVAAVFMATGNDPAQTVESSHCITLMEMEGEDLHMSVTMPCMEVGTIGGGTGIKSQAASLGIIGCQGTNKEKPGGNADNLAKAVCATVLAGEISLCAALATGDLLKAHMALNR